MWAVQYVERYEEMGGVDDILAIFRTKKDAESFAHNAIAKYKEDWYNKGEVTVYKLRPGYNKNHWLTEKVLDSSA